MTPDQLMYRPGLMKGQRVLITGGGTGLGKEMAEACLILGAEVYIWGRRGQCDRGGGEGPQRQTRRWHPAGAWSAPRATSACPKPFPKLWTPSGPTADR